MSDTNNLTKYRPSLSTAQILHIVSTIKSQSVLTDSDYSVLQVLAPFVAKIELGGITPAYTTNPVVAMSDKLGLGETKSNTISKETLRHIAHSKWQITPEDCTKEELELAMTYRFENNLMSKEEENKYLDSM